MLILITGTTAVSVVLETMQPLLLDAARSEDNKEETAWQGHGEA